MKCKGRYGEQKELSKEVKKREANNLTWVEKSRESQKPREERDSRRRKVIRT